MKDNRLLHVKHAN